MTSIDQVKQVEKTNEDTTGYPIKSWPKSAVRSQEIKAVIPGGVNSPFRSFHEVGGHTIFFNRGKGSKLYDIDNNEYIDYVGAWGPAILGHAPDMVIKAVKETLDNGPLFGAPHELELALAKEIINAVPAIESVRFVNSGTEAVMSAIRLARGFTGRDKVLVFEGCYHGHSDVTLGNDKIKHSSGIPDDVAKLSIQATFNDLASVNDCLEKHNGEIACIILEPVTGSMGVIDPGKEFLAGLRSLCTKYDALLIFDEVLTGFRVAYGGAQCHYDIEPDLTCFGKLIGGGMPIGAYGGKKEIMKQLMPLGKVYQAGTFSGNPLTMAGGLAMLKELSNPEVYKTLENRSKQLFDGLAPTLKAIEEKTNKPAPVQLQRLGSMFALLFSDKPVKDFHTSKSIDEEKYAKFFQICLSEGIYLPPTAVDASCLSSEHSEADIERTIRVFDRALLDVCT